MLAQAFGELRTVRLRRAQKVCNGIAALACAGVLVFGAAARQFGMHTASGNDYGNDYGPGKRSDLAAPMSNNTATAIRLLGDTDAEGFPRDAAWDAGTAIGFQADWQGRNADALRETQVRLLWTPETLYLQFDAAYRVLTVFPDADSNGRRDQLWERDVCEAFLQPNGSELRRYKELEVAPNGLWIDLDIAPGEKHNLESGLRRRVVVDGKKKRWQAVLAVPMKSLMASFDPREEWRVNFYRVEGATEPRFYSAWQPTNTPQPNFHVPEAFGRLIFRDAPVEKAK